MRGLFVLILCIWAAQPAAAQRIPLRYGQAYSSLQTIFALPSLLPNATVTLCVKVWISACLPFQAAASDW